MADAPPHRAAAHEVVEALDAHFRSRPRDERDRVFEPATRVLAEVIVSCLDQCGFLIVRKPPPAP